MKKKRKSRATKVVKKQKCPRCHRERMETIITYRINYPFGVNSKPRRIPIRKTKWCPCGYEKRSKWQY